MKYNFIVSSSLLCEKHISSIFLYFCFDSHPWFPYKNWRLRSISTWKAKFNGKSNKATQFVYYIFIRPSPSTCLLSTNQLLLCLVLYISPSRYQVVGTRYLNKPLYNVHIVRWEARTPAGTLNIWSTAMSHIMVAFEHNHITVLVCQWSLGVVFSTRYQYFAVKKL